MAALGNVDNASFAGCPRVTCGILIETQKGNSRPGDNEQIYAELKAARNGYWSTTFMVYIT